MCYWVIFSCYGQSLFSERETGPWIFLIFPSFLRSLVLSRLKTREETRIQS